MSIRPKKPTLLWLLLGLILLCLFLLLQLPANWLVQKFIPDNPYLQQVSGNLWQGQANWQVDETGQKTLAGTLVWQWQPWHLLTGNIGMTVTVQSGSTNIQGSVKFDKNTIWLNDFKGKISKDTLASFANWQLPDAPIILENLALKKNELGFSDVTGDLSWAGGMLRYPMGGRTYPIDLPTMQGKLNAEKQRLHLAINTPQGQRLGDFFVDNDNMLDVELTQRLLKHMPDYQGQGADDSVVISLRQPLTSF
ncbi:type II secretion system protein N [Moraxella macacae]|uniref:type II secretion system protein N n=1 Tax=Moraxella macacae TaxID=765840 RepID=UPI001D0D072D|nr:type II secretion system protein N [Moraxella macacae]